MVTMIIRIRVYNPTPQFIISLNDTLEREVGRVFVSNGEYIIDVPQYKFKKIVGEIVELSKRDSALFSYKNLAPIELHDTQIVPDGNKISIIKDYGDVKETAIEIEVEK